MEVLKKVPYGMVSTYKELSLILKVSPRTVGRILNSNKDLVKYPCYKIVRNNGELGGYKLGIKEKIKRLRNDGINVENGKVIDFKKRLYKFK